MAAIYMHWLICVPALRFYVNIDKGIHPRTSLFLVSGDWFQEPNRYQNLRMLKSVIQNGVIIYM